ncbi:MAG: hypothetical protein CM15mP125_4030 [Gammaproteobacteria bacterium]|nr:MAG: hypothetical protein CM15mP125_4030 [Gammaproteobacteria bacterium]
MAAVYMLREFSVDQVGAHREAGRPAAPWHYPRRDGTWESAIPLGCMAPFLINHPQLISQWVWVRERALAVAVAKRQPSTIGTGCWRCLGRRLLADTS